MYCCQQSVLDTESVSLSIFIFPRLLMERICCGTVMWWRGGSWAWKCDCKVVSPHTHTLRTAQCERTNRLWLIRSEACLTLTRRFLCCYECRLEREGLFLLKIQTIGHRGLPPSLTKGMAKRVQLYCIPDVSDFDKSYRFRVEAIHIHMYAYIWHLIYLVRTKEKIELFV